MNDDIDLKNHKQSRRITLDLPQVPAWYISHVERLASHLIHKALEDFNVPAVLTIVPLEEEAPHGA